jgi:NAD-reducing hydrogenase large subunit
VNKNVSAEERDYPAEGHRPDRRMEPRSGGDGAALFEQNLDFYNAFGHRAHAQLVRAVRCAGCTTAAARARPERHTLFDHYDYSHYWDVIFEDVKPWSYMKFPFLRSLGPEAGWYRVGPLSRVTQCDFIPSPLAEEQRKRSGV